MTLGFVLRKLIDQWLDFRLEWLDRKKGQKTAITVTLDCGTVRCLSIQIHTLRLTIALVEGFVPGTTPHPGSS